MLCTHAAFFPFFLEKKIQKRKVNKKEVPVPRRWHWMNSEIKRKRKKESISKSGTGNLTELSQ